MIFQMAGSRSRLAGHDLTNDNDVYVADHAYGGFNLYIVIVNGKPFNEINSSKRLTWREQNYIAASTKEALDAFGAGMVE